MNGVNDDKKSTNEQEIQAKEQAFLQLERQRVPEKFKPVLKEPGQLLKRIGITALPATLPKGFIKYSPLDFIVEEITPTEHIIGAGDQAPVAPLPMSGIGTVYADLVKVGISTLQAIERIATNLNVPVQKIGYAGIKDAGALTAQRISLRTVTPDQVRALSIPNIFLRNICEGKGAIQVSDLKGNRFTLFIRTPEIVSSENVANRIDELQTNGVVNFFGVQRFGSPRFLSHVLGMLLLQGQFEETVKLYLVGTSEYEWPYITDLRKKASPFYGNWPAMQEIFKTLPYTFRNELAMLEMLLTQDGPDKYVRALSVMPLQINMWMRAYSSYLANLIMSKAMDEDFSIPDPLPLFLSMDGRGRNLYGQLAQSHGTDRFMEKIRAFPFIHITPSASIQVFVEPKFQSYKVLPDGIAVCFDLPKGAYATTVLGALFIVESGIPVPEWVSTKEHDIKEILGLGSIGGTKEIFAQTLQAIMERKTAAVVTEETQE